MQSGFRPFLTITPQTKGVSAVADSPLLPAMYVGLSVFLGICTLISQQAWQHAPKTLPEVTLISASAPQAGQVAEPVVIAGLADHSLASESTQPVSDVQRITAHLSGTLMSYDAALMQKAHRTALLSPARR